MTRHRFITAQLLLLLAYAPTSAVAAPKACKDNGNGHPDPAVKVVVTQAANLGTLARPDPGAAASLITLSPNGTRSIPPNLVIQSDTTKALLRPQAALVQINGGADCSVRIDLTPASGSLVTFTISDGTTTIPNGGTITLNATGTFNLSIGMSVLVSPSTSTINGTFDLRATYN